jgi:hypothetical protein
VTYEPQPGDYFVVDTGRDPIALLIKLATRRERDDPGDRPVSHAGIYRGDGIIIEALWPGGVKESPVGSRPGAVWNEADPIWAWGEARYGRTEAELRAGVVAAAAATLGRRYGTPDIAALALAQLGLRQKWLEDWVGRQDRLICSQAADWAYGHAKYPLPLFQDARLPQNVTPQSLDDRRADYQAGEIVVPA